MYQIQKWFRNLRMNHQVFIFGFLVMTIVLLIILEACLVQASILFTAIQSSSSHITTKQEKRSIEGTSLKIQSYLQRKYQQGNNFIHVAVHNVLHIEKFFQTTLQLKDKSIINVSEQLFPSCDQPSKDHLLEKNIKNNTDHFCYQSLYNQDGITLPKNNKTDYFNTTVSLLSEYTLLFDASKENQLFIFDQPNTSMMISYPQSFQAKNYQIQKRSWYNFLISRYNYYQDHIDENLSFYYSPVFLSAITNDLVFAVISSIKSSDFIGLTAQSFVLSDKNIQSIPINVILANDEGYIILSSIDSIENAKEKIFIYNTTYTGFNESDWKLLQNHANNEPCNQFCDGFPDTFCLYNKYFNRTVQVDSLRFVPENFTLVVFVNVTFTTQLDQQYEQLTNKLSEQILQIEWILIIACIAMLAVTALLIQIIFRPLIQVMNHIKRHIKNIGNNIDWEIFTMKRRLFRQSDIFSRLSLKFDTFQQILGKSNSSKSELCLKIENFQYSKVDTPYDLKQIKYKVQSIEENSPKVLGKSINLDNLNLLFKK